MNITKALSFLTLIFIISSCQPQAQYINSQETEYQGSRSFSIDDSKSKAEVSVHGAFMGTPDWRSVEDEIQRLQDSGDIENVEEHSFGTEGGSTFCFEFSSTGDKNRVYEELKNLQTDLKETDYSVVSLNKCSSSL
ncbi:hypothetical protein [Halobacteriovorax sp.]|uniref:hypothetical protein n=1 Tax=Halobacteriovorax sp. TaxID=2020862 RepID=UPI0035677821